MKRIGFFLFLIFACILQPYTRVVDAQSAPSCHFESDGSIVCTTGGGGDPGNGGDPGDPGQYVCTPGAVREETVYRPEPSLGENQCSVWDYRVDDCSGAVLFGTSMGTAECPLALSLPDHPCDEFSVTSGGITCGVFDWNLRARVHFPEIYLDLRPYPATLVRWPTAVRNGGLSESSGSGSVDYIAYGGGSPGNPQEGDWRDLRLTLTLRPSGPMSVDLPNIDGLTLSDEGGTGTPTLIQWEVPSHPAAGGGPTAESIDGLEELPGDIPLYVGSGRAPYKLFWDLRYYEYTAVRECFHESGGTTCETVGYEWRRHGDGGEIPPYAVQGLPSALLADVNHDGTFESYWDNNLTLRRMDENNHVDNPIYQRSWNWGGLIYWAVREGQGQIGWPGN